MNRLLTVCVFLSAILLLQSCGASQPAVSTADSVASAQQEQPASSEQSESTKSEAVVETESVAAEADSENNAVKQDEQNEVSSAIPSENAAEDEEIPADFFRCEIKVDVESSIYQARSFGPTLEEGRDNSVDEACAVPCAERIESNQLSDDEAAQRIEECTETCSSSAKVLAAACWQNHKLVYTEGEWNENGDAAPTNGAEILDNQQVTE